MMAEYKATVLWKRSGAAFTDNRYSRGHVWKFDGGIEVAASSSPQLVPLPMSSAAAVDPEEAFVASLASCHMLWFLSLAARQGFVVNAYEDHPHGTMGHNKAGRDALVRIELRPRIEFEGECSPSPEQVAQLHHDAHDRCMIANSLRAEVIVLAS